VAESVAEFSYQPNKCGRSYRLVVVRKTSASRKEKRCCWKTLNTSSTSRITLHTRGTDRGAGQWALRPGNVIEQLKNGVNAMRMPVDDLLSNWAYWLMRPWPGILKPGTACSLPNRERGLELLRMEFRRFLHLIVMLPPRSCVAVGGLFTGPWVTNDWLKTFSLPGSICAGWRLPEVGPHKSTLY